jgi:hypothetical protein
VIDEVAAHYGGTYEDVVASSPRDFVRDFVEAFCHFYSADDAALLDESAGVRRIREILDDVEAEFSSNTQKRHALIAELRRARMPWPYVAALVVEGWDAMDDDERDNAAARVKDGHKSYIKKARRQTRENGLTAT